MGGVRCPSRGGGKRELRAAHGTDWLLLLVLGIAHPEQFVNRPVLIAIDRCKYGLACESPVSCVNEQRRNWSRAQDDWVKVRKYRLQRGDLRI